MRVTVRTGGILSEHLPAEREEENRAAVEVAAGATPADVMTALGIPLGESYLMSLNGTVVRRDERATLALAEGDELVIMPPLRAG